VKSCKEKLTEDEEKMVIEEGLKRHRSSSDRSRVFDGKEKQIGKKGGLELLAAALGPRLD